MIKLEASSIKYVPCTKRINNISWLFRRQLCHYKKPFITEAAPKISEMLGVKDLDHLLERSFQLKQRYDSENRAGHFDAAKEIASSIYFGASDYMVHPIRYLDIHVALSVYMGSNHLKGKKVLQIAPNWGPYMYFLQQEFGVNAHGIDKNPIAIHYAKEQGGLNFIFGDASSMPFDNDLFDVIITNGFLDTIYLRAFFSDAQPFIDKVLQDIHRTLKPKGLFLSQGEETDQLTSFPILKQFRSFRQMEAPSGFGQVNIFQK
jgi:2-polyprenyl-3-methyl-5-hydroxy-6-metoxy-1,4-benzoquinol methylase